MKRQRRLHDRRWVRVGVGLVTIAVVLIVYNLIRVAQPLRVAYTDANRFRQIVESGTLTQENLQLATTLLHSSARGVAEADEAMQLFAPLLQRSAWLPGYGPTLQATPVILNAGHELAAIAEQLFQLCQPALLAHNGDSYQAGSSLLRILATLAAEPQPVAAIARQLGTVKTQLAGLDRTQVRLGGAELVAQLQAATNLLQGALTLSPHLPQLLGKDERRSYLVLVQNNFELRATGGFITAIGLLTVRNGRIVDFLVEDSYTLPEELANAPAAPLPMQRHMNIERLLLRDVNWSPDFPATAKLATTLYAQASGRTVDGVITVDLQAVELLVKALEPLQVAGVDQPLFGATVIERMKELWAVPPNRDGGDRDGGDSDGQGGADTQGWWEQRKDFIPLLASAIFSRLQAGQVDYPALLVALDQGLNQRAVQIWSDLPAVAEQLLTLDWAGALQAPSEGDFWALVESNIGYNKVNAVLERNVIYQVLPAEPNQQSNSRTDTAATENIATLLIHYHHPLPVPGHVCEARPEYGLEYDDMMRRCYFNFLRLYVPAGSDLIGISGIAEGSLLNQGGEGNSRVFGGYLTVAPGASKEVIIQYRLPNTIQVDNYSLLVRKQAGVLPFPLSLRVADYTAETLVRDGTFRFAMK